MRHDCRALAKHTEANKRNPVAPSDSFTRPVLAASSAYPKLREHLGAVVAYMELSDDWHDFMKKLNRLKPKYELPKGHVAGQLSFDYDSKDDSGKGL